MLRSAAHETYHFVENYSSKDAADLRDYVIDSLKGNGVDIEKALEKYAKQGYATRDEQISELVADSMFDVFSNEDFIKNLTAKNQTLAKRLANHIGKLVQKIREAVKMLSVRYSNPEIKALMDDAEKLDTIRNMLLEGYQRAGENFKAEQAEGQKNNAVGTAVNDLNIIFSKKDTDFESIKEQITRSKDLFKNTPSLITIKYEEEFKNENDAFVWIKEKLKAYGDKISRQGYGEIILDKKRFENGLRYLKRDREQILGFAAVPKILKQGTEIGRHKKHKERPYDTITFAAPVTINDNRGIMAVVVREEGKNYYKVHKIMFDEQKNRSNSERAVYSSKDERLSPAELTSNNIIPETIKSVKQNLSESDAEYLEVQKQNQLDIINKTNPAPNTYSTWIRSVDDIKTLAETLEDDDWEDEVINPDLTRTDIQSAIERGEITVYSSYPIKNGVFVSPSRMEAESYSGNGKIYEKTVDINDVAWIDPTQGQYAKPDAVYSMKQTDEITKFNMQTAKENRIYRQIFNLLDDAVYTGIKIKKIPDPKFIRQQAQEMLKEVGSKYSVDEFAEELTVVYEYMSQQAGKNLYKTEDFFPNVLAIARRAVDQCTEKDSSAYDDAKEIRDVIKETPIYISPEMKNEIISQFGSYLFSSVIFSTCFVKYST